MALTLAALAAGLNVCALAAPARLHSHPHWVSQLREQVRLRDVDRDKDLDIVIRQGKNGTVTGIWLNSGQWRYQPARLLLDDRPDGDDREVRRAKKPESLESRRARVRTVAWGMSEHATAHAVCTISTEPARLPEGRRAVGTRLHAFRRGPPQS
jgi:hypothetical protein